MSRSALAQIVACLRGETAELRWAAARIVQELRPKDAATRKALVEALGDEETRVRLAALDAIDSIGAGDFVEPIAPLLEVPGELGDRAVAVLARLGSSALTKLKKRYPKVSAAGRARLLELAVAVGGATGVGLVVEALQAGHVEAIARIARPLGEAMKGAPQRERKTVVRKINEFLADGAARAGEGGVAAALDLLGRVSRGDAQDTLLRYTGADHPGRVRRRALEALADIAPETSLDGAVVDALLGLLKDRDYGNVVAPAMEALQRTSIESRQATRVFALLRNEDPALRRFGIRALGQVDTPKSAEVLLGFVAGDNPDLRKRAAESLARLPSSVAPTVAALVDAGDAKVAWLLARLLVPRAHEIGPKQVTRLAARTAALLEPGDSRAEALLLVLRDRHLPALEEACLARIKKLRRDRKAGEILNLLRPIVREGSALSPAGRYEAALAEIMHGSRDVVREVRLRHPGLKILEGLLHEPEFELRAKLKRDKSVLEPDELYLIGSHFAERAHLDKAFGGDLLRWIVKTFPEDSASESAAHKLMMEGFPPPPQPRPKPVKKKAAPPKKPAKPAAKAPAKAASKKKAAPKRATPKKATQKKATPKKRPVAKKAPAKKTVAKKKATTKTPAAKKPAARKKAAKASARKKAVAKKAPARKKAAAKKTRRR